MFTSALKSFSSNIGSNYSISASPSSVSGPWRIFDGKKKTGGKSASIFILDRKAQESHSSPLGRSSATSIKRATEEVIERLKKEASSLARLRHPNILELVEPVEETRGGGLQFATETVTASLAGLLIDKDDQERAGGVGGRSSRYVTEDADGGRKRRELELDELEIQKGLLQISKALEFLHDNAGLVHGNLTPEAIYINGKADWKISGLSFLSPADNSNKPMLVTPINLSEALNIDPRLPQSVQIALDWTSPDFVLDNNLNTGADMFSLGLLIIALYNSPHRSPLQTNSSISTYKRLFTSSATIPTADNNFLCPRPIPKDLTTSVLPRLITRRPAQRMTAKEFQQSPYFDNILISTIRFLDALPAKTPNEKTQFMRGLLRVLPSFPKSILDKKVLPALLEEMKDRDLLSLILQNVFKIVELLPSARRPFTENIVPRLKGIFVSSCNAKGLPERDPAKEAGMVIVLEYLQPIATNCSGKDFKDHILPIINLAIESPTHSLVDSALRGLPIILPVLDYLTIKNDLFPVVASVFSKTSSLGIKVRGLEAFVVLCGGSSDPSINDDGLNGSMGNQRTSSSSALDKYTIQDKILPLIRAIKTKEPTVAMATLKVLKHIGGKVDADFVALHILPILWSTSLGPLLNLQQFQAYIETIKVLSSRVEADQIKKLQELGTDSKSNINEDFMSFGGSSALGSNNGASVNAELDFERLVKGSVVYGNTSNTMDAWDVGSPSTGQRVQTLSENSKQSAATFAWSTPSPTANSGNDAMATLKPQSDLSSRTITPDLARFETLVPSSTQFSQVLQPQTNHTQPQQSQSTFSHPLQLQSKPTQTSQQPINWGIATPNAWNNISSPAPSPSLSTLAGMNNSLSNMSMTHLHTIQTIPRPTTTRTTSVFSLPPPPGGNTLQDLKIPQQASSSLKAPTQSKTPAQKSGLDAFESLL